jgi:integrase
MEPQKSRWTKAAENLVRHQGGVYYLYAKVAGKPIRVSLETEDLRVAKLKRDEKLAALRRAAELETPGGKIRTLGEAIDITSARLVERPHTKESTNDYYRALIEILRKTLPVNTLARAWNATDAATWWKKTAKKYSAQRANNLLSVLKTLTSILVESGVRIEDPAAKLRRVRIIGRQLDVPSREDMEKIIQSIATQGKRASVESSHYVAFLAYSGCRHGEAASVRWEDIDKDWLTITGGETGTKNHEIRRVPISGPLRVIIEARRYDGASGPIFYIVSPRIALDNACMRLGVPHLRLHDLRHFFATWCIEKGVDIPTVAKWLGHKDGGVLAMKTYGHLRDEHSLASARKLD